jgi:hypothetical protein
MADEAADEALSLLAALPAGPGRDELRSLVEHVRRRDR